MSTHFVGEGNIGSAPDYREFPNGNDEPRRLLRLNVYFDNRPARPDNAPPTCRACGPLGTTPATPALFGV